MLEFILYRQSRLCRAGPASSGAAGGALRIASGCAPPAGLGTSIFCPSARSAAEKAIREARKPVSSGSRHAKYSFFYSSCKHSQDRLQWAK